jgi:hypothetical protein
MEKHFEAARAQLQNIADRNRDGSVNGADARLVINQLEGKVLEASAKWPIGTIIVAVVIAGVIAFAIARALPCH